MKAKSKLAVFELAHRLLVKAGHALDMGQPITVRRKPETSFTLSGTRKTTWGQLPIVGTKCVVVVRYIKVTGMPGEYDVFVVNQEFDSELKLPLRSANEPVQKIKDFLK